MNKIDYKIQYEQKTSKEKKEKVRREEERRGDIHLFAFSISAKVICLSFSTSKLKKLLSNASSVSISPSCPSSTSPLPISTPVLNKDIIFKSDSASNSDSDSALGVFFLLFMSSVVSCPHPASISMPMRVIRYKILSNTEIKSCVRLIL